MKLKNLAYLGVLTAVGVAACGMMAADTYADVTCPSGSIRDTASSYAECNLPEPEKDDKSLMETVSQILNVVIGVVGVVAVAVIIIGGIYFVISQGDASKVTRARNTILYGVVGLIVSLLAFAIVNFVLSSVFSSSSTTGGGSGGGSGDSGGAANP